MGTLRPACLALAILSCSGIALAEDPARTAYSAALGREQALRKLAAPTIREMRGAARAYEAIARRHPKSPYSDNALWQAAGILADAFKRFGEPTDQDLALKLLRSLETSYPTSSLVPRVAERRTALAATAAGVVASGRGVAAATGVTVAAAPAPAVSKPVTGPASAVQIRSIERLLLPDLVRVVLELDGEVPYREERLWNPDRLFFDLKNANAVSTLLDANLKYSDDIVRQIRLGRHNNNVTRVVLDVGGVARYSVYPLYNPFRLVIDCTRAQPVSTVAAASDSGAESLPRKVMEPPIVPSIKPSGNQTISTPVATPMPPEFAMAPPPAAAAPVVPVPEPVRAPEPEAPLPVISPVSTTPAAGIKVPIAPSTNSDGHFSLARQLGLGISRIVIDPGHGGQDPGAQASKLTEAALVLDIALRLEKLLLKQPGVEVVMTRRTDVFVPLEERTSIANRAGADLFLSIHANASRNPKLGGVETYFLNFASNPAAEALAARENSGSISNMGKLPDIVRAIALNTKLDESRDFAGVVQQSMVRRLRTQHKPLRDLGVKQAPFVVLIGAGMPSVLAEVSFVTNRDEGRLLRGTTYRQRIAEALFEAVGRYQRSLKNVTTVAQQ